MSEVKVYKEENGRVVYIEGGMELKRVNYELGIGKGVEIDERAWGSVKEFGNLKKKLGI